MENTGLTQEKLSDALSAGEFIFHYQPILSLSNGHIDEAEALIRWQTDNGLILPGEFIPFAEKTGFITEITKKMFGVFCQDVKQITENKKNITLCFNISATDLKEPHFAEHLIADVEDHQINVNSIKLELTESAALKLNKKSLRAVTELISYGIGLSIDDFGTGNATFENLKNLPFDTLKIDRNIISNSLNTPDSLTLLDHSVNLGHQLKLDTIAEGVETDSLMRYIGTTGCNHIQGFVLSKALPLKEFIKFVKEFTPCEVSDSNIGEIHKARIDFCDWVRRVIGTLIIESNIPQIINGHHTSSPVGVWLYSGDIDSVTQKYKDLDRSFKKSYELAKIMLNAKGENDLDTVKDMYHDFIESTSEVNRLLHEVYMEASKKLLA